MPQLLRGIVRNVLADHRDMRVMREVEDESLVLAAVEETEAQFVIWGIDGEIPEECPRLFQEFPRVRVLAIEQEGRSGFLYELRPSKLALGQLSGRTIVDTIRVAVG